MSTHQCVSWRQCPRWFCCVVRRPTGIPTPAALWVPRVNLWEVVTSVPLSQVPVLLHQLVAWQAWQTHESTVAALHVGLVAGRWAAAKLQDGAHGT